MKLFFKFLIIFTSGPLFSLKFLRNLRWYAYKKIFNTNLFYVAEYVKIVQAHPNKGSYIKFGKSVHVGEYAYIDYSGGIQIGNHVAISEGVKIFTHNHNVHGLYRDWNKNEKVFSNLLIQDYAWIGANSMILESVTEIAEGSIVAAGAVLTKNTEPYSIYAGNPAKNIGKRLVSEMNAI